MIEKRAAQRFRVLKGGAIAFEGGNIPCTVRNMSSGGAAVDLAERIQLPPTFTLTIERDHFERRCRPRVGIAFCQA